MQNQAVFARLTKVATRGCNRSKSADLSISPSADNGGKRCTERHPYYNPAHYNRTSNGMVREESCTHCRG